MSSMTPNPTLPQREQAGEQPEQPVTRRSFLKRAALVAGTIFIGVPVVNHVFFGNTDPNTWEEGEYTVVKRTHGVAEGFSIVDVEWVQSGGSSPTFAFGVKCEDWAVAYRDVEIRIVGLSASGHLLSEQAVVIPCILPGETCRFGDYLSSTNLSDEAIDRVEVFVGNVGETVFAENSAIPTTIWPYSVSHSPRTNREYATVEISLAHDHTNRALLGDAVLSAACVCVIWRSDDGKLLEAETRYVEGLEVGVPHTLELFSFEKSADMEVYVRPWRRDETSIGIFKNVEVTTQR